LLIIAMVLPLPAAGLFAVTTVLPFLILISRALLSRQADNGGTTWYPAGYLIALLNGCALALLAAGAVILSGKDGGMVGAGQEVLAEMLQGFARTTGSQAIPADALKTSTLAALLPALVLTSWQFMVVINGLLAQGVLARFGANIRPGERFAELFLPQWLTMALAAAVLASFLPGQLGDFGRNAAILTALPFFFLGLSVIHAASNRWLGRGFILLGIYLMVFVAGWPAMIVAAIGVFEPWTKLRARFASARDDDEEV